MRRYRSYLLLIAVAILTAVFGWQASFLKFNYDIKRFFPTGNSAISYYLEHSERFATDNDFTLIALYPENGQEIFDPEFLSKVDTLESKLQALKFSKSTLSLTSLNRFVMGPSGPYPIRVLHPENTELLARDAARLKESKLYSGTLMAKDYSSLLLVLNSSENLSKSRCDTLLGEIEQTLAASGISKYKQAGRIPAQSYYLERLIEEFAMYTSLAFVLVLMILFALFRNVWGVVLPVIVISLAAVWTLGFAGVIQRPIDPFTSLLPMILFVVGTSDIIHIFARYIEELRKGTEKKSALKISMKEIGMATVLTSLTTAIGFLSLLTNPIEPIQSFGILAAAGVCFALLLTLVFFPIILWYAPVPSRALKPASDVGWNIALGRISDFVAKRNKLILWMSVPIVAASVFFCSQIRVNNLLLDDLSPRDALKQTFQYFDENYGGVRPIEFGIHLKEGANFTDYEILKETDAVTSYIQQRFGALNLQSPAEPYKILNMAFNGGQEQHYKFPDNEEDFQRLSPHAQRLIKTQKFKHVISEDRKYGRIYGRMNDIGSAALFPKYDSLEHFLQSRSLKSIEFKITGTAFLIDESNKNISGNLISGLLIAMAIVALIAGFIFRNIAVVAIAIFVNLLPLAIVGGIMGIVGIDLKVSTAIIFTIAFGIAVDDTIHFLTRLKKELMYMPYDEAIFKTIRTTGKAIVLTSIVLISGFAVLVFSSFASTFYIGLLISLTLVLAVVCDLFLLPALLLKIPFKEYSKK
jgi:predicted RND superfamily exporter protein